MDAWRIARTCFKQSVQFGCRRAVCLGLGLDWDGIFGVSWNHEHATMKKESTGENMTRIAHTGRKMHPRKAIIVKESGFPAG